MNKPIPRRLHGVADYSYAALVPATPLLAGFDEEKNATRLCYALGSGALLYSVFTRAEWGLFRIIPFKAHLTVDRATSVLALGSPWLLGFSKNKYARNSLLAIGATGLILSLLTQNDEMES